MLPRTLAAMTCNTPLLTISASEARERNCLSEWRESHKANCACKTAIEAAIRRDFDGMHLNADCAESVIAEYGYLRTAYVLSNTLQALKEDGRFSRSNLQWAQECFIPPDFRHNSEFQVNSHPAVLNGFVEEYRDAVEALHLFDRSHCQPDSQSMDYEGQVLVLSAKVLKETCWSQENQLWLATGGFGCSHTARGRTVFATCLADGEHTSWYRQDFLGILQDTLLPDWARENLDRLRNGESIWEINEPQYTL